ncbi:MAG: NAD(P)H-hydrate dehydratase [Bdellovibrio sp.]|nr:NAD(P)H-hydrate dehydratase [Bdellovibrio sp.]
MRVVTIKEMKEIETKTFNEYGLSEDFIIENVGIAGAHFLMDLIKQEPTHFDLQTLEFIFLIGRGNNGSDGLSMARHLTSFGLRPRAFLIFPDGPFSPEIRRQIDLAKKFGVKVTSLLEGEQLSSYFAITAANHIVVDAIFGTGTRFPLGERMRELFDVVNEHSRFTVSVDICSGVHADTGDIAGGAIRGNISLAIGLPKPGHYLSDGGRFSGDTRILTVGFPEQELERNGDLHTLDEQSVKKYCTVKRNVFAHKNAFGHTILIGGSFGLTGALSMGSLAALSSGAGLVTAATWSSAYPELLTRLSPTIMSAVIPETESEVKNTIENDLSRFSVAVCGSGMGRSELTRVTVLNLLSAFKGPVVLDADAINALNFKEDMGHIRERSFPTILTPHIGELARFIGIETKDLLQRPLEYLREVVNNLGAIVVLKDACTLIGGPNGQFLIHYRPNDGMAKGGSGDVLAGLIGGLLSQEFATTKKGEFREHLQKAFRATALGVYLHAEAGNLAAKKYGPRSMTALNIIDCFPAAFTLLEEAEEK